MFFYFEVSTAFISKIDSPFQLLFDEYLKIKSEFTFESYKQENILPSGFDIFILNSADNQCNVADFVNSIKEKNNSIVIIPQIRASKEQLHLWEDFKKMKTMRVSLEFYYFGLIFFRKENSQEHFKIRF